MPLAFAVTVELQTQTLCVVPDALKSMPNAQLGVEEVCGPV